MLKYKFDYIYHYAAVVGVKRTLNNPDLVLKDLEGFKNIFDLAIKSQVKKFIFHHLLKCMVSQYICLSMKTLHH